MTNSAKNSTQALLSVRNLHTEFVMDEGTTRAVDGVSFDVMPGQVLGIVGESGCGKSATIKSILRIVEAPGRISQGEVLLQVPGREPVDLVSLDARGKQMRAIRGDDIALIPQEPMAAFSPVHTIGNQMIEAVRLHRKVNKREAHRIAVRRLADVGVPDPEGCMSNYAWQLSGGLRQRAMIGMALTCDPKLLIADEPTTAIDVTTQAQVLTLLRELQQKHGTAIIFITHDLGVIAQLADHVVVMYLGKVMESAPIDTLFHAPVHPYTRALLQSIPAIDSPGRQPLPTIEGSIPHPFNRPSGCPFFNRCRESKPGTCDQLPPATTPIHDGTEAVNHTVSCYLYTDSVKAAT